MDEKEAKQREHVLNEACRHRLADEKAENIVANAEKYLAFLKGDKSE